MKGRRRGGEEEGEARGEREGRKGEERRRGRRGVERKGGRSQALATQNIKPGELMNLHLPDQQSS